jgi:hypothetical protein
MMPNQEKYMEKVTQKKEIKLKKCEKDERWE